MGNKKAKSKKKRKNSTCKQQESDSQSLTLLQGIRDGSVNPKSICPADRSMLVALLIVEGQSTAEIALLLKTSDRTIERDRKLIRDENAMERDPKLAEKIAGMLFKEATQCTQRIRKFQRDKDASPANKMEGELHCFQILCQLSERLQSLGFLTIATQKIEADLKHRDNSSLSLEQMLNEIKRLIPIEEKLLDEGTEQLDSIIDADETIAEFEGSSPT